MVGGGKDSTASVVGQSYNLNFAPLTDDEGKYRVKVSEVSTAKPNK